MHALQLFHSARGTARLSAGYHQPHPAPQPKELMQHAEQDRDQNDCKSNSK